MPSVQVCVVSHFWIQALAVSNISGDLVVVVVRQGSDVTTAQVRSRRPTQSARAGPRNVSCASRQGSMKGPLFTRAVAPGFGSFAARTQRPCRPMSDKHPLGHDEKRAASMLSAEPKPKRTALRCITWAGAPALGGAYESRVAPPPRFPLRLWCPIGQTCPVQQAGERHGRVA